MEISGRPDPENLPSPPFAKGGMERRTENCMTLERGAVPNPRTGRDLPASHSIPAADALSERAAIAPDGVRYLWSESGDVGQ